MDNIEFLKWLTNRLIYKHGYREDDVVIQGINSIHYSLTKKYKCDLSNHELDILISQYYVDFLLEPSNDFKVGFSEQERENLRNTIRNIINNAVNKNFSEPLIN